MLNRCPKQGYQGKHGWENLLTLRRYEGRQMRI